MTPATPPNHRLDFLHFEWVAKQYQLFGDLLQRFPSPHLGNFGTQGSGPNGAGGAAAAEITETYADPDHYIFNAAM